MLTIPWGDYTIYCPLLLLCVWVCGWGGLCFDLVLYGGSYMSAHVLMNLLNELRKIDKM